MATTAMTDGVRSTRPEKGRVVLIVEDNLVNRMVLAGFLDQVKCDIVYAENGAVAVERFKAAPVDVILMDINMPVMDGLAATKKIRSLEDDANVQRTPIVAVTAHDDAETKQDCDAAGMDGFIPKPVNPDRLVGALSQWIV